MKKILISALFFITANAHALDLSFGAGIGICSDSIRDNPNNFCDAGHVEKVFVRLGKNLSKSFKIEAEGFHLSHAEPADFSHDQSLKTTSDMNGLIIDIVYTFNF